MGLNVEAQWPKLAWDTLLLVGAAVLVFGLWLAWHPLGFIVGGVLIIAAAILGGYTRRPESEN